MKLNLLSKISRSARALFLATLAVLATGALKAQTGTNFFNNTISTANQTINLGNASGGATLGHKNWAIFALSGGVTITDSVSTYGDPASYDVYGNVGLGGGTLSMTASWIKGSVYRQSGAQTTPSGSPFITGTINTDAAYVNGAVSAATAASTAAAASTPYSTGLSYVGYVSTPTSIALTGFASITGAANSTYVINLTDLNLSGPSAVLSLIGTDTTNFIFNVSRFMTLANAAKITVSGGVGGLTEANVLFNVTSNSPQYDVGLSGGSEAHGIILAPTRNVKLTAGSKVFGEIIAKGVSLSGISKVINPYFSP